MTTGRSPDLIQKEIEQTRVELAETIDAIADRISPRRAASRGAQAVKAQVTRVHPETPSSSAPATPRSLRTDRVLLLVGALAALAGVLILRRSRS